MPEFSCVTGQLFELHRYINVPMRWCEQYPSRERREFWVIQEDGREVKIVVHTRSMPARHGHRVRVLLWGGWVVGLSNLSTGQGINFLVDDPPLVLRRSDVLKLLVLMAAVGLAVPTWSDGRWLWLAIGVIALVVPVPICLRAIGNRRMRMRVQDWLTCIDEPALGRTSLRRVK